MKKRLAILCLAIASVSTVFYSCSEDVAESIKGSIVGTVTDDTTGELISVAKVLLKPDNKSTVTGSDGTFEFNELDAGKYTVEITKTGYEPNTTEIVVSEGQVTESHILMERIPAIITADKEVLDFGANSTVTSLSFNIVNKSYKALEWSVDCTSVWVSSIEPKTSGKLDYGKTATLIVKIDRNKLESGYNESYLVVFSEDGSVEVKLTAIGAETAAPVLNILEATDVKSSSVRLNAKIINPGIPEYTKRGFVYGVSADPTIDNVVLQAEYDDKAEFSCEATNLTLGTTYYVRAYAINKMKGEEVVTYSANSIQIATKATSPKVAIAEVTSPDVEKKTAVLNGVVVEKGDPSYSEKGFVYGKANNPTIESNVEKLVVEGDTAGEYSALATGLELDVNYYVRAYVINEAGVVYSEEAKPFKLGTTLPEVSISDVTDKDVEKKTAVLNGCVDNVGTPAYQEKGFVYSTTNNPTIETATKVLVDGKTAGKYSVEIADLQRDVTYYVRAYAISETGTVYSDEEVSFSLATTLPEVVMSENIVKDVVGLTATFNATITNIGTPVYTSKGFVYATTNNPTIESGATQLSVAGITSGGYSAVATNLQRDVTYYVRAYAISETGTVYSDEEVPFSLATTLPKVTMNAVTTIDLVAKKVTFTANVNEEGVPAYTERGFVYGTSFDPTVENDIYQKISGNGTGYYEAIIPGLEYNKKYYVRAYVKVDDKVYYSAECPDFTLATITPSVGDVTVSNENFTLATVRVKSRVTDIGVPAYKEKGFVYSTSSNPSLTNANSVVVEGLSAGDFYFDLSGLTTKTTYYVKAYITDSEGVTHYSDEETFIINPTLPTVNILAPTDIDIEKKTAQLHATVTGVGDPSYTEKGFVYATTTQPTIENSTKISVDNSTADYSHIVEGLSVNQTYYVRAYIKSEEGVNYSSEQIDFSLNGVAPKVSSASATVNLAAKTIYMRGRLSLVGSPRATERGFIVSTSASSPTMNNYDSKFVVSGMDTEYFDYTMTDIVYDKTYYIRAYAKNEVGVSYSTVQNVNSNRYSPNVGGINLNELNLSEMSASIRVYVTDTGFPSYTELGVVYSSTNSTPTLGCESVVIENASGDGYFYVKITDLIPEQTYYVRAYVKNEVGMVYSASINFSTVRALPTVTTYNVTDVQESDHSGVFHGKVTYVGNPAYTERGFVYSTVTKLPTIDDAKVVVSGSDTKEYYIQVSGMSAEEITYVRAYATNSKGTAYGGTMAVYSSSVMKFPELGIMAQCYDAAHYVTYGVGKQTCSDLVLGEYSDWRLPTQSELNSLFTVYLGYLTGYSKNAGYWTSTFAGSNCVVAIAPNGNFWNLDISPEHGYTNHVRCVRTLK